MLGAVSTNRRASAFARVLAEREFGGGAASAEATGDTPAPPPGGANAGGPEGSAAEQSELVAVAEDLERLPKPVLAPEVKSAQRARLLAAMESTLDSTDSPEGAPVPGQRAARRSRGDTPEGGCGGAHRAPDSGPFGKLRRLCPGSRWGKGLAAGGLSIGVAASALGGISAASTDALPGDSLYGLKRGMEDLQLNLASGDADRGQLHLTHAATRLREARRLLERDRTGQLDEESLTSVRSTLSGMRRDVSEGHRLLSAAYRRDGDLGRLKSLSTFAEDHRAGWTRLRDRLPRQLTDVGNEVNSVFDAIDSEVHPLRQLARTESDHSPSGPEADRGEPRERPSEQPPTSGEPESLDDGPTGSDGERPEPTSPEGRSEGLLQGGLLSPPSERHTSGTPSESGPADSTPFGQEEVTLPPVVPEVLPRLGLKRGDE
ncbi:hypothetical protein E0L36_24295 [Streptomyces sp. AJS327]|uniref:DUF5667 domain-containing protein n=1 Tax=Streptomyces sp. AJS327 TaxID=2545265 RepID=UPI0015DFA46E|nr:DUF5667 domain-containing protein [Streptomyces sp. AJS327]MBA0053858.1 hypothetical protein [Streptomyces sp. AJS327]